MAAYAVGLYNMQDRSWLPAYKDKVTALLAIMVAIMLMPSDD
jgi:hypothetical protein